MTVFLIRKKENRKSIPGATAGGALNVGCGDSPAGCVPPESAIR